MKYAIKIRSIIWRKISIYSVQGLPVGSNNVGFDVIGASPEECYGYAGPVGKSDQKQRMTENLGGRSATKEWKNL